MDTSTLLVAYPSEKETAQDVRRQAVLNFCALLQVELLDALEESDDVARSPEEVLGTIARESFDVQMAVHHQDDLKFRREYFDLLKKGSLGYIDSRLKHLSVSASVHNTRSTSLNRR